MEGSIKMADQHGQSSGVADIVFLIDATGSMGRCMDAVRDCVTDFIAAMTTPNANNENPVKHWRAKVVGYRDAAKDGAEWFVANPFVDGSSAGSVGQLQAQLGALTPKGGDDEPESLIDALISIANMATTGLGEALEPDKWRHHTEAHRIAVVFTDASWHEPDASGATFDDLKIACETNRIKVFGLFPSMECYLSKLSMLDKAQVEPYDASASGDQRFKWQIGLQQLAQNRDAFRKTMEQIAQSVSVSTTVPIPE